MSGSLLIKNCYSNETVEVAILQENVTYLYILYTLKLYVAIGKWGYSLARITIKRHVQVAPTKNKLTGICGPNTIDL